MLGTLSFSRYVSEQQRENKARSLKLLGDKLILPVGENAFGTVMGQTAGDFNWGGNCNAAAQGIALVYAYKASKDRKYLDMALSNLDYLLGRNATGYSFVTGFGSQSPCTRTTARLWRMV